MPLSLIQNLYNMLVPKSFETFVYLIIYNFIYISFLKYFIKLLCRIFYVGPLKQYSLISRALNYLLKFYIGLHVTLQTRKNAQLYKIYNCIIIKVYNHQYNLNKPRTETQALVRKYLKMLVMDIE